MCMWLDRLLRCDRKAELLERDAICRDTFQARSRNPRDLHPVTLGNVGNELEELLARCTGREMGLIFTRPNADTDGRLLNVDVLLETHPNAKVFDSLGEHYLSAMNHVDAVVGNSSSGLYEAPSFGIATVNIGDRQKGRLSASSVIHSKPERHDVVQALRKAITTDFSNTVNPYGDGYASERIIEVIRSLANPRLLLQKHFFIRKGA